MTLSADIDTEMIIAEYKVECPWGLLVIYVFKNSLVCCRLFSSNGSIVYQRAISNNYFQLPLPLGYWKKVDSFVQQTDKILDRAIHAISSASVRRSCLLRFCVNGGVPAIELLEDCPALALLLSLKAEYSSSAAEYTKKVATLVRCKRHQILRHCSYPSSKWVIGLLRKIQDSQYSPYLLNDLKEIIDRNEHKQIRTLHHLKKINRLVVDVMKDRHTAKLVSQSFYNSASTYPTTDSDIEAEYLVGEIKRLSIATAIPGHRFNKPRIRTVRDLERVHELYIEHYQSYIDGELFINLTFPDPPIPKLVRIEDGEEFGIFPLETGELLYQEGENMAHCIASYGHSIMAEKNLYAYHVSTQHGEEATILIKKEDVTWHLIEIRGHCNQNVSAETEYFVEEWLKVWHEKNVFV